MFKGKQQLYWSNGLKSRLGVANRTDEELAEETEKESIEIQVATQIWRLVLRYKLRSLYLRAVEQDYLENSVNERVYNLIMPYAQVEQDRLNALERERLRSRTRRRSCDDNEDDRPKSEQSKNTKGEIATCKNSKSIS